MIKIVVYCYIILTIEQKSNSQIIMNSEILKECIFKDAPKNWFVYIKAFLHMNMRTILNEFDGFDINILKYNIRRTSSILQLSNKVFFSISKPEHYNISQTVKPILWYQKQNNKNIRILLKQKWIITLDEKLRVNITFDYIDIYVNSLLTCDIGVVHVTSVQKSKLNVWVQQYCGIQSDIICFPPHKNVEINVQFKVYTSFDISMRYSITDLNHIISSVVKSIVCYVMNIDLPGQKMQIVRFIFNIQKYKYLRITFPPKRYLVEAFDGPGTLCPMLPSEDLSDQIHAVVTSSSQCILNIYTRCKSSFSYANHVWFTTFDIHPIKTIIFNNQTISNFSYHYNNKKFNNKVDITKIVVPHNFKINITIENLDHNYSRNFMCNYGGFAVYNLIKMRYRKYIATKCFPHTDIFRHQHIYSKSSAILLVAYSYNEYGLMSLRVAFSTTKCNIVRVNCRLWRTNQNLDQCIVFQFTNQLKYYFYLRKNLQCSSFWDKRAFFSKAAVFETFTMGYQTGKISSFLSETTIVLF